MANPRRPLARRLRAPPGPQARRFSCPPSARLHPQPHHPTTTAAGAAPHQPSPPSPSPSPTSPTRPSPSALLAQPTWSVRALLPPARGATTTTTPFPTTLLPPSQLHHLLRLSALPPPPSPSHETAMLATLSAQLHFVRDMQRVDTTGIPPLASIRDETPAGLREATVSLATLRRELDEEEVVGRCKRPRRRRVQQQKEGEKGVGDWDVLSLGGETAGRYFVVRSGGANEVSGAVGAEAGTATKGE